MHLTRKQSIILFFSIFVICAIIFIIHKTLKHNKTNTLEIEFPQFSRFGTGDIKAILTKIPIELTTKEWADLTGINTDGWTELDTKINLNNFIEKLKQHSMNLSVSQLLDKISFSKITTLFGKLKNIDWKSYIGKLNISMTVQRWVDILHIKNPGFSNDILNKTVSITDLPSILGTGLDSILKNIDWSTMLKLVALV